MSSPRMCATTSAAPPNGSVNGRVKDDFGGRDVRVRGHAKVFCHLMFGVLALTIDQLMRLVTQILTRLRRRDIQIHVGV